MRRRARRLAVFLALWLPLPACCAAEIATEAAALITTRAELLHSIDARALKPGDAFFLRTTAAWQRKGCTIPSQATISGVVEAVDAVKGSKQNLLSLRFDPVACTEIEDSAMTPLLIAMQHPRRGPDDGLVRMETAKQEETQLFSMFNPNPPKSTTQPPPPSEVVNTLGIGDERETPLNTGEVNGIRGVTMQLPQANTATTLLSHHDITLERSTEFVLTFITTPTPAHVSKWKVENAPGRTEAAAVKAPEQKPEPAIAEVCAAQGCQQVQADTVPQFSASPSAKHQALPVERTRPGWSLPLTQIGGTPRLTQNLKSLDDDADVQFLGPSPSAPKVSSGAMDSDAQVLVTFQQRKLIPRTAAQIAAGIRPRAIRAVLLSQSDGHLLREQDWAVPDDTGPYLWRLGDRVLAHIGDELVVFDRDLVPQQRFSLPGPLLFVSTAPSGDLVLVATVHEKHTKLEHEKLAAFLGPDWPLPEEYDLTALNAAFQPIGAKRMQAEPLEPALLQTAMVSAGRRQQYPGSHWTLQANDWDGQSIVLAQLGTSCAIQTESLPGDLLFTQGCQPSKRNDGWFRLLNAKGQTLLKGNPAYGEFLQQGVTDPGGKFIAIASTQFDRPIDLAGSIREDAFTQLKVTVYRISSGKAVFTAQLPGGSALKNTIAISPDGTSLAVLTSSAVQVFALPK